MEHVVKIQVLKKDDKNTVVAEKDIPVNKFKERVDIPIFEIDIAKNTVKDLI